MKDNAKGNGEFALIKGLGYGILIWRDRMRIYLIKREFGDRNTSSKTEERRYF
jgi:hypothetical protein